LPFKATVVLLVALLVVLLVVCPPKPTVSVQADRRVFLLTAGTVHVRSTYSAFSAKIAWPCCHRSLSLLLFFYRIQHTTLRHRLSQTIDGWHPCATLRRHGTALYRSLLQCRDPARWPMMLQTRLSTHLCAAVRAGCSGPTALSSFTVSFPLPKLRPHRSSMPCSALYAFESNGPGAAGCCGG